MALLHVVTIALHVLFAAAWFGLGLALPTLSRAALAGGAAGREAGAANGGRVVVMMTGSVLLFYAFAVLNWTLGMQLGYELQYNAWPYHASLTLGLVLVAAQLVLIRPGWNKLTAGPDTADAGRKRIMAGIGIGHLTWIVIFILMYVGRGVIG
ncbi:hypothetical protein RQM47_14675 [Rubrivirga sp. S365]|uniref:Copper resistance protein D n=1 Tax=Rubrivirga litoralis TaxID=3075598 RepID=A0ABU3BUL5_9BACT|nr:MULTISPECIES: hypothetical protein [unclassified Rubrivirga]MDT0632985.1 hypothetical protein [Rubrivirga sp. F394]MDT7857887.1 hypothetical protein [Rubrivirga sp. S365]